MNTLGALRILHPDLLANLALAITLATALVHLMLAVGVAHEASRLEGQKGKMWFMGPLFWALATLLTGLLGATAYWLMHHSTLKPTATHPDPVLNPQ